MPTMTEVFSDRVPRPDYSDDLLGGEYGGTVSTGLHSASGYVYCMGVWIVKPYIKVGYSRRPDIRQAEVNRGLAKMPGGWSHQPVELLAVSAGTMRDETCMHRLLRGYRVGRTEWFMGCGAVAERLENAGNWQWLTETPGLEQYVADPWTAEEMSNARRGVDTAGLRLEAWAMTHVLSFVDPTAAHTRE